MKKAASKSMPKKAAKKPAPITTAGGTNLNGKKKPNKMS